MCHLHHFWYDRRKEPLNEREMIVYDALNKEELNPSTVYSWFLATRAPVDIKLRYRKGKITSQQIVRFGRNEVEKQRCRESNPGTYKDNGLIEDVHLGNMKSVVIFDDVMTSGAQISAIGRILRSYGFNGNIYAVTLGRTVNEFF